MTEAWFYVTEASGDAGRHQLLLRLLERALRSDRKLYLHCADQAGAERCSELLWQGQNFIPHGLSGQDPAQQLLIGFGEDPGDNHDVLVNLEASVPDHFSRFERVIELVSGDTEGRNLSREKWTFYKHRGYPVTRHELG